MYICSNNGALTRWRHHVNKSLHNFIGVVCTNPSSQDSHRYVSVGRVMISRNQGGVMIITQDQNARGMGSNPAIGSIFPLFITPITLDPIQARTIYDGC